ncbi:MAG: flagellar biosynthesis protein FlhF [Pyrinomonas methylaliphatogenes]|nr:flagellar biosynthesis protein FlhF [Pyrinomonas methylaliphatogenes]
MTIRCYRAATMREALEKIKSELGEDALVLDTRRVRARSWFGFGGREMVEVRVAEPKASKRDERERNKRSYYVEREGLRLLDDSPAMPSSAASEKKATDELPSEPVRSEQPKREARSNRGPALDLGDLLRAKSELEIGAERARKSNGDATSSASAERTQAGEQERQNGMTRSALTAELERLRAELREVKFALGAFAARADGRSFGDHETRLAADEEPLDPPFYEAYLELTAIGLTPEYARRVMRAALALNLTEAGGDIADLTRSALVYTLNSVVQFASDPLAQGEEDSPVVAFIGPTGVGKTTTIAKLAARVALRARRRVELITLDTYRIAAIEQLKTYAEIIGSGFHVAHSTIELDALIRRRARGAVCIIDTVGRSPHDLADQMELADYLRANDEIIKCLVLQATMHPVDALAAAKKFALYGANRLALTKLDETSRPGAAAVVAADARVPLTYLCAGQRVPEDLEQASAESFALRILRAGFGKEGR